jgi:hypothetical protein
LAEQVIDLQQEGLAILLVIRDGVTDDEDLMLRCLQLEARCWLQRVLDHFQVDLVGRFHVRSFRFEVHWALCESRAADAAAAGLLD